MDTINYIYDGKTWKESSTVSDKNSFFHAAFGVKNDEDGSYLDKRVKYRRRRWATFLSYFEDETMPPRLTDTLQKCLSVNEKYEYVSVEDQDLFEDYVSDIMKAEYNVTTEEIPILAALENVKVVLFKYGKSEPVIIIKPNNQILGSYPNAEKPKGEVVLHMDRNVFSRMTPLVTDLKDAKESAEQSGNDLVKYIKGGSAGSEGVQYQVGLLTVFFLNALQKLKEWKLSTENKAAGKFDDVVIEWPEGATLLQAKHKQSSTKKIGFDELVPINSKKGDFSIPKYLLSYEEIKKTFKVKEIIICTNAKVDDEVMKFLNVQKVEPESLLYYENSDCQFYIFNDEIIPYLKEYMKSYYEENRRTENKGDKSTLAEEDIKQFLKHLQLFFKYPPGNNIDKVTEQLLSHLKLLENLYDDVSPLELYTKMLDWFQQKDGIYITELYAKAIFSEIWTDKHWQRLEKYKIFFQCNDLNFQDSKSLFHLMVEGGCLLQEIKIFHILRSDKNKILFVSSHDDIEKQKQVLEAFSLPQYTILVLIWPKVTEEHVVKEASCKLRDIFDKFGYKKVILVADCNNKIPQLIGLNSDKCHIINTSTTLKDLSNDCQEGLLMKENIIFQGSNISLKELLAIQDTEEFAKFLNTEDLEKLVTGEKIKVGTAVAKVDENIAQFYIKRKFRRKDDIFSEEQISEMNEKVVLISDSAGTGKTTTLTNLAVTMKNKYPHLWVIRIDLNDYTKLLKKYLGNCTETITLLELLNFKHSTKLINYLEQSVFSMSGKVVLMLDGFDEISPDYTQLVLSLLSHSQEQQNFAKIIVTTRPYVALELEKKMQNVDPFIMEPFTEQNQIDFLTDFWMHNLDVDDTERSKCQLYVKALTEKMSTWVQISESGINYFATIPLHIWMLAEIFEKNHQYETSDDWKGCYEYLITSGFELKLPKDMNVMKLYRMFIEKKRSVFIDKGSPSGNTAANQALMEQFEECLAYHKNLAVELIFGKTKRELFVCRRQTFRDLEMAILKIGIVQKVDNEFHFAHRTFAEYFVAESLVEELHLPNRNVAFQMFLIEEIILKSQFIIHVFFDSFLQQMVDVLPHNTFHKFQCVSYKIRSFDVNKYIILNTIVGNGHLAILQLILKCVRLDIFTKTIDRPVQFFKILVGKNISRYSKILNILQQKAYVESVSGRMTFLEHAAEGGHLEMVKFLVEQGVNVNIDKSLHLAVNGGHFEVVKFLVDQGADDLYKAVSNNDFSVARYLLDTSLEGRGSNITDYIIPYTAAYLGRLDILKKLIGQGLDVNGIVENGESVIFGAVRGGQLEIIRYLVQRGCDINCRDQKGNTALHVISQRSSLLSTAKLLLELEIDANAKNFELSTSLHIAVEANNFDLAELLVNCGADASLEDIKGNTPLHVASQKLEGNIVKFLVGYGVNINSKNRNGYTALYMAIEQYSIHFKNIDKQFVNSLDLIKFLIENGGDVNSTNSNGSTILHLAVKTGQFSIIILLMESGVDTNFTDKYGRTALHLAALEGYTDIVKFLVQHNADCNIRDNYGHTVLHSLVQFNFGDNERCDILRLVIDNDGDVNLKSNDGRTSLHFATSKGDLDVAILLVESGVDVNIRDAEGCTALHLAAREGHLNMVEYLLKSSVGVTVRGNSGYIALHLASSKLQLDEFPWIRKNDPTIHEIGADVDTSNLDDEVKQNFVDLETRGKKVYLNIIYMKDKTGCTALHLAALRGHLEIVKSLVQHGADVNNKHINGRTVLHASAREGHAEIVKFLLEKGVDVGMRDNEGRTPLHLASERDALDVLVLLVKFGVDVDARDKTGNTALHHAVSRGHFDSAKYLVEAGVDIRIRNNCGYTALHLAAKGRYSDCTNDSSEYPSIEEDKLGILLEDAEEGDTDSTYFFSESSTDLDNISCDLDIEICEQSDTSDEFTEDWLVIFKTLLEKCNEAADIKDESGRTALHLAVLEGQFEIVEILMKHNADDNIEDDNSRSALQVAIDCGKLEIAKLLVEYGANINQQDWVMSSNSHRTVLHLAAERGKLDTFVFFAKFGIDVNVTDDEGYTALQLALDGGYLNIVKYLVEMGADVTGIENYECSVLHLAAKSGDLHIVTFFAMRCSDVNVKDKYGNTALHLAVCNNRIDVVEFLVNFGINVNLKNSEGRTALHFASDKDCLDIANFLVSRGADLDAIDNAGATALHLAACWNLDLVTLLVKCGANIYIRDSNGDTPATVAEKCRCTVVLLYLEKELYLRARLIPGISNVNYNGYLGPSLK